MANFETAIPFILEHEGGFCDTPAGEVVNRGINIQTLKALGERGTNEQLKERIRNLTLEETKDIYQRHYWTFKPPCFTNALDQVESQVVANKILDMCVLNGQGPAIKLIQRALKLPEDACFGPDTLTAVNKIGDDLIELLITIWSEYLTNIADRYIANVHQQSGDSALTDSIEKYWEQVKVGWLARAKWNGQ